MKGVFCFILVALAVIYSCDAKYGVSNLKVKTVFGHNCDFSKYNQHSSEYRPWKWDSCTARYDKWVVSETGMVDIHRHESWDSKESTWPWCYHDGKPKFGTSEYDACEEYYWSMHVDNVLKPSPRKYRKDPAALRKWEEDNKMEKYFFYRWFYNTNYVEAYEQCKSRSMRLATFHSHFDFNKKTGRLIANSKYWKSVKYIKTALAPLSEQQAKFWIYTVSIKAFKRRMALQYDETNTKYPVRLVSLWNKDNSFVCEKING